MLPALLRELTSDLCSSIGSLTNASKISRTLQSVKHIRVDAETISAYLKYLTESFLFSEAVRYDIKGKKYFEYRGLKLRRTCGSAASVYPTTENNPRRKTVAKATAIEQQGFFTHFH